MAAQHALSLYHLASVHVGEPEAEQYVEATVQTEKFYTEGAPALRAARLQVCLGLLRAGTQRPSENTCWVSL